MTDDVLDTIAEMRERPGMYIGSPSLDAMFLFLAGYVTALHRHTVVDLQWYSTFVDSLYSKYRNESSASWAALLITATGDDAAALDLFFEELDAFRSVLAMRSR